MVSGAILWTRLACWTIIERMRKNAYRPRLCVERLEPRLCMAFGALDTSFGENGLVRFENMRTADSNDEAYAVTSFTDGTVVMAGISEVGRGAVSSFAKLDGAGQLVPSFGVDGRVILPYALTATGVVAASDGSLYISGSRFVDDAWRDVVLRMLSDGAMDNSFGGAGYHVFDTDSHLRLVPTSDAGVAVLTQKLTGSPFVPDEFRIWKLDSSGHLDPGFGIAGVTQSFDPSFPLPESSGPTNLVQFRKDDSERLLVAGQVYSSAKQTHELRLIRFTPDGSLDTTFGDQGRLRDPVAVPADCQMIAEEASGGATLVVWTVANFTSTTMHAKRLHADGSEDLSFGTNGLLASPALPPSVNPWLASNPMVVAAGPRRTLIAVPTQETLSRYRYHSAVIGADGQFDMSYGDDGVGESAPLYFDHLKSVGTIVDPDGKIRIAASGYTGSSIPPIDWHLFGLDANGRSELAFGQAGTSSIDFTQRSSYVRSFGVQPADISLVALYSPDLGKRNPQSPYVGDALVEFYHRTGDRNADHASGGAYSLGATVSDRWFAWSPVRDGGLLTAGIGGYENGVYSFSLRKLRANGQFDESFGQGGRLAFATNDSKFGFRPLIKQSATGQVYVAMHTSKVSGNGSVLGTAWVAKANAAGRLDLSFGDNGFYRIDDETSELADFVVAEDGRLCLLLTGTINWPTRKLSIVALNAAGHVDTSFADQGTFSLGLPQNAETLRIVEDESGRLLVLYRSHNELHVHRVTSAGQSDPTFASGGDRLLPQTTRSVETFAEMAVLGDQLFVAATTGIATTETTVFALRGWFARRDIRPRRPGDLRFRRTGRTSSQYLGLARWQCYSRPPDAGRAELLRLARQTDGNGAQPRAAPQCLPAAQHYGARGYGRQSVGRTAGD